MMVDWIKTRFQKNSSPLNILDAGIRLPEIVYVVAGGPNGKAHYHRIPKDAYTIATNKSVLIPDVEPDMWILNSTNSTVLPWIKKADKRFHGTRAFRQGRMQNLPNTISRKPFFHYASTGSVQNHTTPLPPNALFAGGTVSGLAIQIAAHLGAQEIVLCGVDMSGSTYWDGTSKNRTEHKEIWDYTENLNWIIQHVQKNHNATVRSLSQTQLSIPTV